MSNTVNGKWNRGNNPTPGTASTGYPYVDMEWNQPSDDSNHSLILSPVIDFPLNGQAATILVNTEAVDTSTSATVTVNVYGSATNDATISKWEILDTVSIANADFDATTYAHVFDIDAKGLAPYMKIGLDPSADLGAVDIRVAVVTGAG
tara:strand:+ start:648 stop:1094 length:447 start_codon:yes stop_codon:yes gene_type:complete